MIDRSGEAVREAISASLLVGREREQTLLDSGLHAMLSGHGQLVLISGEAGIGKTSLVEWLAGEAAARGCLVLAGGCYDLTTTPPYGPWRELVGRYRPTEDLPAVPAFVRDTDALGQLGSQDALFRGAIDFFLAVAAARPLVLILEDLHWADQASLDLLRVLARSVTGVRLMLVATFRDDELTRRHALYQLLPALVRESRAQRIDLHRLSDEWLHKLITSRYPLTPADAERLVVHLHAHSEGNPFFALELLRSLEEERLLLRGSSTWELADLRHTPVPPLVRQVIERRLSRLGDEQRPLLEVAAIIGQTVPLALWQQVSGVDEDTLNGVLERGLNANILRETQGGASIEFTHALIREALYEGVIPLRRRKIHRLVGETLALTRRADTDTVAFHFQQADDPRAVEWLIRAAHRAEITFALRAAAERYEAAATLLEHDPKQTELRGWLLFHLAHSNRFAGHRQSLAYLETVEHIAGTVGNRVMSVAAQAERGFVLYVSGAVAQSLRVLNSALAAYDEIPSEVWVAGVESFTALFHEEAQSSRAVAERHLATLMESRRESIVVSLAMLGRFRDALDVAERWWSHWEAVGSPWSLNNALGGAGIAHAALGDPETARAMWQRGVDLCLTYHNHLVAAINLFRNLFYVHLPYATDDHAERRRLLSDMLQQFQQASDFGNTQLPPAEMFQHPLLLLQGSWVEAKVAAETIVEASRFHPWVTPIAHRTLAILAVNRGDSAAGWGHVHAVLPQGPATEPGDDVFLESQLLQHVAVDLALDAGDLATAHAWLEAHDRWLAWSDTVLGRAEGHLLWAQYHDLRGESDLARQRAEQALEAASNPRQPLALVAIRRFLGHLDTEDQQFERAKQHLQVSLTLAGACAAPFERALTLLALAELCAAEGEVSEARSRLAEVRAICEPLDAKPTLEKVDALFECLRENRPSKSSSRQAAGLTVREVEVLRLVAQGLTDSEVAGLLFISPRTVGQHLRSIYNKLGVNSRTAAAVLAKERDIV